MVIQAIVEGHGEVNAVPELLRRLCYEAGIFAPKLLPAIRAHRTDFSERARLERWVRLAKLHEPSAIIIIYDADDDCAVTAASLTRAVAQPCSLPIPCEVVVANREYESWFLAAMESLRGHRGIAADAAYPGDPEEPRDAKGRLSRKMVGNRTYSETADQAGLTATMDLAVAHQRCRSFRKMVKVFGELARAAGHGAAQWPPAGW